MRATTLRFSDDLWQLLEQEARGRGISTAEFIRESALLRLGALAAAGAGAGSRPPERTAPDVARAVQSPDRIAALRATGLLDTPPDPAFERVTRMVSRFLNVPVALISLVDADRQFFKSCIGVSEPWGSRRQTPLSHSFCQHVVARREPLVVTDAREHPDLRDSLAIADLDVVAYLGVPLIDRDGHVLGSLCGIDGKPRVWSTEQIETLRDLAEAAMAEIELATARRSPAPAGAPS